MQLLPLKLSNLPEETSDMMKYQVSFPSPSRKIACPSKECTGTAETRGNLRRHSMFKHPRDGIIIEGEGPLPGCLNYSMFVHKKALESIHKRTEQCKQGTELKHKRCIQTDSK
jgi:hypothetical protein